MVRKSISSFPVSGCGCNVSFSTDETNLTARNYGKNRFERLKGGKYGLSLDLISMKLSFTRQNILCCGETTRCLPVVFQF